MFESLWGKLDALFKLMEIFTTDSVASVLSVSGGIVMSIFWFYAAYKIIELLVTMRDLGGGEGLVWTVWTKARRPIVTYVLMLVGPVIVSGLAMQAVSHARNGKTVLNSHIGKSLGEVDAFWDTKTIWMATNVNNAINQIVSGEAVGEDIREAMREFQAAAEAERALAEASKATGANVTALGAQAAAKAKALFANAKGIQAGRASVAILKQRIAAKETEIAGTNAIFDPVRLGIKSPGQVAEMERAKAAQLKPLEDSLAAARVQLVASESTLLALESNLGIKTDDMGAGWSKLFAYFDNKWAAMKLTLSTIVAGLLMIIVYVAVLALTVAIVKEGFGIMVYIMGFVAMAYAGLALAAPLAPIFMLAFVSERTEQWGRNYINFFLSMLFGAAGLEVMARLAGRTLYTLVNVILSMAVYAPAGADTVWAVMSGVIQVAAVIFIGGMGASFVLGLVKRGTALGTGLFGGSFSY